MLLVWAAAHVCTKYFLQNVSWLQTAYTGLTQNKLHWSRWRCNGINRRAFGPSLLPPWSICSSRTIKSMTIFPCQWLRLELSFKSSYAVAGESCKLWDAGANKSLQIAVSVSAIFLLITLLHVRQQSLQVSQLKESTLKRSRKQKPGQGMSVQRDVQGKGH